MNRAFDDWYFSGTDTVWCDRHECEHEWDDLCEAFMTPELVEDFGDDEAVAPEWSRNA